MKEYTDEHPQDRYTNNMVEQVGMIDEHYAEFENYLQKFDKGLSSAAKTNTVVSAVKKVRWTLKELKGKVDALKFAITALQMSINMLLILQIQ